MTAPVTNNLGKIAEFESTYNIKLPLSFIQILNTFSNKQQHQDASNANGWLSLENISLAVDNWKQFLTTYYGEAWQSAGRGQYHNPNHIAPVLFNDRWIPFLRVDSTLWCMDFAPNNLGIEGQIIRVDLGVNLAQYHTRLEADDFSLWFEKITKKNKKRAVTSPTIEQQTGTNKSPFSNEIRAHINTYIGDISAVFQENKTSLQPLDLFWCNTTLSGTLEPSNIIITCGMSARPIPSTGEDGTMPHYAELLIILPPDWPININAFADYNNYWPLHWLKTLARLPHRCNQWIGEGQTFANSQTASTIANTPYGGFLLFSPLISLPEEFSIMETPDGGLLHFYALVPLTPEELTFKNNFGLEALLLKCKQNSDVAITDRIVGNRPSAVDENTRINLNDQDISKRVSTPPIINPAISEAQLLSGMSSSGVAAALARKNAAVHTEEEDHHLTEIEFD
ncbi:MAG: suppressor of fused domain protein [Cardiobacteriaceae bacterium]|nr:suppressor of fused domain protein [Cardiobacteriaceae bacterium]